jgi:hypothetical protein
VTRVAVARCRSGHQHRAKAPRSLLDLDHRNIYAHLLKGVGQQAVNGAAALIAQR